MVYITYLLLVLDSTLIPILNEVDSPGLWIGRTAGLRSIAALILILQIEAKSTLNNKAIFLVQSVVPVPRKKICGSILQYSVSRKSINGIGVSLSKQD